MTSKRMPAFRLKYKAKDGTKYDIGVAWESDRFPGLYSIKPERETITSAQYPKMRMSEACRLAEEGDGFLDLSAPKSSGPAKQTGGSGRHTDEWSSGGRGSDDDLPF